MNELIKEQADRLMKDVEKIINKYRKASLVDATVIVDDMLDLRNGIEVLVLASDQA